MGVIYRIVVSSIIGGVRNFGEEFYHELKTAKIAFRKAVKEVEDYFAKSFGSDGVSSFSAGGESGMSFDIRAIDCPMSNNAKIHLKEVELK